MHDDDEIQRAQNLILRVGTRRFGPPDPATHTRITAIRDTDRLERMIEAVFDSQSWRHFLESS